MSTDEICTRKQLHDLSQLSRALTCMVDLYMDDVEDTHTAIILYDGLPTPWFNDTVIRAGATWAGVADYFADECYKASEAFYAEHGDVSVKATHLRTLSVLGHELSATLYDLVEAGKEAA